jgi:hypothetical protein
MAKQTISVGAKANDGTGDTIRAAAIKINQNFKVNFQFKVTQQNSL